MELKISHCNNFYKIKGSLNKHNINVFHDEFEDIFEHVSSLTISVEELVNIDSHGVKALSELHKESIQKNKSFSIIGSGCKELYDHFKTEQAA